MKWLLAALAAVVVIGAVTAGLFSFAAGGSAECDEAALAHDMTEAIASAERAGIDQTSVELPAGCSDDDMTAQMPAVSRSWHAMPGGLMMREPVHTP